MKALAIGKPAPDFTLPDENGNLVQLASFRGRKVVLFFYPKDATSGCTIQACGFRDSYPTVKATGAIVLGVSPDGAKSHQKFKANQQLPFPLLTDANHAVAERYGAWGEKSQYGRRYMGIIRSHFVIDEEGRLTDMQIKISPQESVRLALEKLQ